MSYPRNTGKSVNQNTPKELSTVQYAQFDDAIKLCLKAGKNCKAGKSDMTSAFRHLGIRKEDWKFLVMKAKNPIDKKWYYFVDKCLPFGASISCAHFQAFSDAVSFIVKVKNSWDNVNYLDDFFFAALLKSVCDKHIQNFLDVCSDINFPVSMEKTFWGRTQITFLGLLIDTARQLVLIPEDKINRAIDLIDQILTKQKKKIRLQKLQQLCGFLNFLGKSLVPGRAFTRRLYSHGSHLKKKHHHLPVTNEMKMDLTIWKTFLLHPTAYSRQFFEFDNRATASEIDWYTDASSTLGCGGYHKEKWFIAEWEDHYLQDSQPSINYLELYAVTVAILLWAQDYKNRWITLFCDNMSVIHMINTTSSKCKNCMILIRLIVLHCLVHNVKITAKHVLGVENSYADHLSRLRYKEFRQLARKNNKKFTNKPEDIPESIWPPQKIWLF